MHRLPVTAWRRFLVISPVVVLALAAGALGHLRTGARSEIAMLPVSATAGPSTEPTSRPIVVSPRPGLSPRKALRPQLTPTVKGPSSSEHRGSHVLPPADLTTASVEKAAARSATTPRDIPIAAEAPVATARSRPLFPTSHTRTGALARPKPHATANPARPVPVPSATQVAGATPGVPMRLRIPALDVNARVESVGLSGDAMAVPANPWDVAWFALGPRPGIAGNSVIDGHLDTATGPAIFLHLGALRAGDLLYVTDNAGVKRTFRVTALVSYPLDKAPLTRIFGPSTGSHLNLITCDGTWLPQQRIYDERLVVYSTLV